MISQNILYISILALSRFLDTKITLGHSNSPTSKPHQGGEFSLKMYVLLNIILVVTIINIGEFLVEPSQIRISLVLIPVQGPQLARDFKILLRFQAMNKLNAHEYF